MPIQATGLHHKHTREREQLGPNNKSAVTPSEPVEPRTEQDLPGPNTKLNVEEILTDLEHYHPRRKGWTWRNVPEEGIDMGDFHYRNMSTPLKQSMPLPAAEYFENIDPQPAPVVTSEIASGHFEDDLRRMRMAAWHGADHIMVIRTTGQSHIDGLLEGTPEGIGGVPITRKQLRASRKACDLIEDEVGRPINFHSYVSGVAGPAGAGRPRGQRIRRRIAARELRDSGSDSGLASCPPKAAEPRAGQDRRGHGGAS